ncbi:MAG: putative Ig domain-containing protein [Bacteroidales bacterium]|nr:putative Ig domain-containing protein [Bacteroidales bacterium]
MTSVLYSQSNDELIIELKVLNERLNSFSDNAKRLSKSSALTNQVIEIKDQIYRTKKKLNMYSNDLDNPVYFDNNIYLDYNVDLLDFYVYEYSTNYYEVHARLKNKQRKYLEWVKLRYNLYSNGSFIGTDYTYIDFESYGYTGISPYKYSFIETYIDKADFDSVAYQIEYDVENGQDDILWDQILNLQSVVVQPSGSYNKWQGVVNNNHNYSMKYVQIYACVLKDNKMLCNDYTFLDVQNDSLPPNSSGVFDSYIDLPTNYDEIKYYLNYSLYSLNGSGNLPPNKPIFTENNYSGSSRENISFDLFVIDPNGNWPDLLLDYGDGSTMNWEGSFYSGYNAGVEHAFATGGQFIIKAKSKDNSALETDWSENVTVDIVQSTTPQLIQSDLDSAKYKNYYSKQLGASNGILPYSWQVTNGSLPDGLNLNISSGLISGQPTKSGNFDFTVTVSDAGTPSLSDESVFDLFVINHTPVITSDDTVNTFTNTQITYVASATDLDGNTITYDFINYSSWLSKTNSTLFGTSPSIAMDTSFSVIATDGELSDTLKVNLIVNEQTSVLSQNMIPKSYALFPNFPNPFNPQTNIKIALPKETDLKIYIYSLSGRIVKKVFEGQLNPGFHNFVWNANDQPSGTYFIKVQSTSFSKVSKCLLLK